MLTDLEKYLFRREMMSSFFTEHLLSSRELPFAFLLVLFFLKYNATAKADPRSGSTVRQVNIVIELWFGVWLEFGMFPLRKTPTLATLYFCRS